MTFAAYFILSGCDTHIDFLWLLMQEYQCGLRKLISQAPEDAMFKISLFTRDYLNQITCYVPAKKAM